MKKTIKRIENVTATTCRYGVCQLAGGCGEMYGWCDGCEFGDTTIVGTYEREIVQEVPDDEPEQQAVDVTARLKYIEQFMASKPTVSDVGRYVGCGLHGGCEAELYYAPCRNASFELYPEVAELWHEYQRLGGTVDFFAGLGCAIIN